MKCSVLAGLVVALAACSDASQVEEDLTRLDAHHTLGASVAVSNLTVWPVFTDRSLDLGEFLTLSEALAKGEAEVREQDSDGRVDTLVLENKADLPILICAGTVVAGGKQDRQIGQDFVVQAKATTPIDAFCVEQGRWTSVRQGEQTDLKFTISEAIAVRSVRSAGQYEKNQGRVWKQVAEIKLSALSDLSEHRDVPAFRSSSLAVVMDATSKAVGPTLEKYAKAVRSHFAAQEECIGFAYAINGEPITVRTFAHPRLFRQQFGPFLKTMAAEALLAADGPAREARAADVVALVKGIADTREEVNETAGINRNGIKATRAAFASSCYVERKGKGWVALTNDWTARR
ncbi:MAG: ARPP-1 family domain-containing protein [Planctomycetota bacterium]|jgi:hypothetical protein